MRVGNAYKIVESLRNKDKRYENLISTMESNIEYQKSLSLGLYINFTVRTKLELSKPEIKAITIYLTNKYFYYLSYRREGEIFIEYRKLLFGHGYVVKLI